MKPSRRKSNQQAAQAKLSTKELRELQKTVLKAVLLGQQLPGSGQKARLPDSAFIMRHPDIYLSDENLAGRISLQGLSKPLRIVSTMALQGEVRDKGEIAYLRFSAPDMKVDTVVLTLEGKIVSKDPNRLPLGLSSVHCTFKKVNDKWEAVAQPFYSAA